MPIRQSTRRNVFRGITKPKKKKTGLTKKRTRVSRATLIYQLRMYKPDRDRLDLLARRMKVSRSKVIRALLKKEVEAA